MIVRDYRTVTETPGESISPESARMFYSRYAFTAGFEARRVLEVGCGSGQGLAYLARRSAFCCGVDITHSLVDEAQRKHPQLRLVEADAQYLPFSTASFDLIALHEALYYLQDATEFFADVRRVLSPGGRLVIASINPAWSDFNPSPFAVRYFSASELKAALEQFFPDVAIFVGFRTCVGFRLSATSAMKRTAVRLNLIPKTMRSKRLLKRLVFGPLVRVPAALDDDFASYDQPCELASDEQASNFKILYAVAQCGDATL